MSRISVDVSSARIPVLQVGYQGENEVTDVLFDISSWITEFGEGVAQLRVKRPGNSEEESYVLSLTITDGIAVWTVSETDTFNKGNGKVQLSYLVGNIVKKAVIYPYKVGKSIVGADNPVDPFDSWIERSKAWAIGETLDGGAVPETDETYQNNAKYYAEQADILGSAQVVLATEQVTLATEKATLATEKADAAAASEANAAASEAAVNGVSTQLTTRMTAIETEQSVQSARMDTFTSLPEGSTSGNAELADIRVGANGTTYDTAGNAVRGQIGELKSDLTGLENRVTALDGGDIDLSYNIIENSYVANTDGTIYNYNGWNRTSYINLNDVKILKIIISKSTPYNYFYKADKSPLENGNLSLSIGINEVTIPENAAFLICSGAASAINSMTVELPESKEYEDKNAYKEVYNSGNLIDYSQVSGGYIGSTGVQQEGSGLWCTNFCELTGNKVYLHGLVVTQYFAFYDESKTKIATWENTGAMTSYTGGGTIYVLDVPTGAKYFRGTINNNPSTNQTAWVSNIPETPNNFAEYNVSNAFPYTVNPTNPCDYSELTVRAFSKVVCIGDSLTYGDFNIYNGGSSTGETQPLDELSLRYSYPSNFQRITGIETVNKGDNGETTVSWYAAHSNEDYSQFDLAIIHLGVNDSSYNVSDADTLTAMQNIVTMLSNARSDMRIAVCSCIPAYDGSGYQAKGQLILNWAKGLNNPNIIPLDLARYSHVKPRTSYVAGHLSALGYYMMAYDIARYISWYMDQHKRDFRFIQFIGSPDAVYEGD